MDALFFSDALLRKMAELREAPLTAAEAPAGYGKTTAVHMALDGLNARSAWYTAVESVPDGSFDWFIRELSVFDEGTARALRALGFLNRSNAAEAARLLLGARVAEPCYLVVDNFQFVVDSWQPQIAAALANRPPDGLHVVLISQNFGRLRPALSALERNVCRLTARDLLLGAEDIRAFAGRLGLSLREEQIRTIREKTDGWAVAVALFLENLRGSGGELADVTDTDELLRRLFWERLTERQREVLLRLSLFDRLRESQLPRGLPEELFRSENVGELLARVPLVRFDPAKREYYPHEILLRFLRGRLALAEPEFQREVYRSAGRISRDNGRDREAVEFFFHAGDWEGVLSCPLSGLLMEQFEGLSYTQLAETVLESCPEETAKRYPLSVLRLCYALYAGTSFDSFSRQMERARLLLEMLGDDQLMGEWQLLSALEDFPDLDKMKEAYLRAAALMDAPSAVFVPQEPFLFGCTSMWYLFYTTPGEMLRTADKLADAMKVYNSLTGGRGEGAPELYRGEALSVQGRFEESEIQAYQAAFLSERAQNASVTYGAALLLGINAIYQSDMIALQKAIEYLENKAQAYPFLQGRAINTYMVETVRGYLLGLMMETGRSALWTQGEADSLSDLTFTNFMIKTCRITDLILKRQYRRAIASVEASLKLDMRLVSLPTRNFMYTGLALCYLAIGRPVKAADYLDQALTAAERDKNFTFLACFRKYFSVLFLVPGLSSRHAAAIREIRRLKIHYTRAEESRIFSSLEGTAEYAEELTDREREIAELAAQGMRNSEIASQLHLSENTVKYHLKTVFQKMNIDRRSGLVELLK